MPVTQRKSSAKRGGSRSLSVRSTELPTDRRADAVNSNDASAASGDVRKMLRKSRIKSQEIFGTPRMPSFKVADRDTVSSMHTVLQ